MFKQWFKTIFTITISITIQTFISFKITNSSPKAKQAFNRSLSAVRNKLWRNSFNYFFWGWAWIRWIKWPCDSKGKVKIRDRNRCFGKNLLFNSIPLEWGSFWHLLLFALNWGMVFALNLRMSRGIGLRINYREWGKVWFCPKNTASISAIKSKKMCSFSIFNLL